MNKKVSTLLTCGLILGGSLLCGSAFAQDTNIPNAKENVPYALMPTHWWNGSTWQSKTGEYVGYDAEDKAFFITSDAKKQYHFYVNKQKDAMGNIVAYEFVSVEDSSVKLVVDNQTVFAIGGSGNQSTNGTLTSYTLEWKNTDTNIEYQIADNNTATEGRLLLAHDRSSTTDGLNAQLFALDEISESEVEDSDLNALFNEKGFNLGAKSRLGDDVAVQGNLFDGNGRIRAYKVDETAGYYRLTKKGANGKELQIPNGLYFFTELKTSDSYDSSKGIKKASDIDWLESTLIAVSPVNAHESTDVDRKAGEGFQLTEVKGGQFIYEQNTSDYEGDDISIYNACFTGMNNHGSNANYPYALYLNKFYYQETKKYEGTTDQKEAATPVMLDVVSFDNETQYLITQVYNGTDLQYVFNLSDSAVLDGISLLNETKTPAVYTIKFVAGNSEDANLIGKYLTVGSDGNATSAFQWEAKGAAIANPEFPAFQYVITAVDKENAGDEKYTLVTFTNRETDYSFEAKLFPEEGTNRYSMALSKKMNVVPFTVNTTTYTVDDQTSVPVDENVIVELTKVTPDEYAGFLNVDDGTIRTITFARDRNVTSNNLYVSVNPTYSSGSFTGYAVNADHYFANDLLDAAQWQLVKSEKPSTISRVFVYNNTTTKSVDDVPEGDKVSAYTYKLQYVNDGSATGYYLKDNVSTGAALTAEASLDQNNEFYIKENVDGSVSLFIDFDANDDVFESRKVAEANKLASFDVAYDSNLNGIWNSSNRPEIYESESEANNLKVYLGEQPASISWEDAGHITIQSELGNYISMDDSNKGIVVNESNEDVYYLHKTDENAVVPSFYISEGLGSATDERMFMFNPVDSVDYYVAPGTFDKEYQAALNTTRVIFKPATINETCDTLTMNVKGEGDIQVAATADNNNAKIWGGLNRFKFQIVETEDGDGLYYIRQIKADKAQTTTQYLYNINDELALTADKTAALTFAIKGVEAPTANESVSATEVKVIAVDGSINIKNAAGKNVVVSTILGQIVANEVLTSDNATISVPAGIAIVSVDGEEAVKVSVK